MVLGCTLVTAPSTCLGEILGGCNNVVACGGISPISIIHYGVCKYMM